MTIKFVNRIDELGFLSKEHKKEGFSFLSVIGRRRVGKTALIEKFISGKKALYFFVPDIDDKELRLLFAKSLNEKFGLSFIGEPSWDELFDRMLGIQEKVVIVIDEFQRFLTINKSVPSILQKQIDNHHKKSGVFLVVMGSSIGMMHKLFEYSAPLYGRRTGQIDLDPLKFRHLFEWFPSVPIEKLVEIYAIFGGTPKYLLEADAKQDMIKSIEAGILSKRSALYNEPEMLIRTELPNPATYFNIMKLIAQGRTKTNEIADMISIKQTSLSYFLNVLEKDMGLIRRENPVTKLKPQSKKTLYFINDNFFNFWFRFVYPNMSYLEIENSAPVVESVKNNFTAFVGKAFEGICKEVLIEANVNDRLPFSATNIGRWWSKQDEIDIIAFNKKAKEMLFCECKWKDNVNPGVIINNLKKKSEHVELFKKGRKDYYAVFVKSFSKKAKENNVLLFDIHDMKQVFMK
ncbi:MAG: ATP-binding protein [Candidatus Aenigmarchaeota archaeon]|nr:ATP-binding protein [Candidatus Aenigmarchaeota archaeon]